MDGAGANEAAEDVLREYEFGRLGIYCEQMMLDEGYGQPGTGAKDALEAKYIRLGQLQDALLRDARFVVGIKMHTGKMSFEEAKEFFVKEGFQTAKIAEIESKRGTSDPTYLYYTLGKLQILKLREDYKKKVGAAARAREIPRRVHGTG